MRKELRKEFLFPSDEFTPIPFWFWNDELSEEEITRQLDDFCEKGVMGFVIHPRKGFPESIPYLSDTYMHYVKYAVEEAEKRNMKVVLYDEAMYPSGSAHGLVVKENPEYATRALRMEEGTKLPALEDEENLLAVITAKEDPDGRLLADTLQEVPREEYDTGRQAFFLIETYSKGTIRGIHIGEDDLEEGAPASGDLLNPEAMDAFIRITYERYYEVLSSHFGNTVIAMFTDEPCVLGRCHRENVKPWTVEFSKYWKLHGGKVEELPLLWKEESADCHKKVRKHYQKVVGQRLRESYYEKISNWCEKHGIALTGHPEKSDDIGVLRYFHIPGQDVVWRWVAPENETRIAGAHATMGKCSSDAARHYGKRRNSNECFGCCGPSPHLWAFTADDMKWYMDWLFVRGVNLLYPHAFFYSIDGEERYRERPPDVGPNNLFWPHYRRFSDYVKRMCYLMTDSYNTTAIAVLGEEEYLPWKPAKELFEAQIEFNYLEEELFLSERCELREDCIEIEKQSYRVILADFHEVSQKTKLQERLQEFQNAGGTVIYWDQADNLPELLQEYREITFLSPCSTKDIRISHVVKEDVDFYVLVNEGSESVYGIAEIPYEALKHGKAEYQAEYWNAWEGTQVQAEIFLRKEAIGVAINLGRIESLILCVNPCETKDLSELFQLGDWTRESSLEAFSGTRTYEATFHCDRPISHAVLDLGEVHEIATLRVNGKLVGTRLWAPYRIQVEDLLQEGENRIHIEISNTPANQLEQAKLPSGLFGPVKLIIYDREE